MPLLAKLRDAARRNVERLGDLVGRMALGQRAHHAAVPTRQQLQERLPVKFEPDLVQNGRRGVVEEVLVPLGQFRGSQMKTESVPPLGREGGHFAGAAASAHVPAIDGQP